MVHISGFQLTTQDSLPAVIRDMINDSDSFEWKKPVPLQDEHDLIDMATFISAEVKHESNPDQKGHYTWKYVHELADKGYYPEKSVKELESFCKRVRLC